MSRMLSRAAPASLALVLVSACGLESRRQQPARAADSVSSVALAGEPHRQNLPATFRGLGRPASAAEVRVWDIDASASGAGLPRGSGRYERGAVVYAQQ